MLGMLSEGATGGALFLVIVISDGEHDKLRELLFKGRIRSGGLFFSPSRLQCDVSCAQSRLCDCAHGVFNYYHYYQDTLEFETKTFGECWGCSSKT